MPRILSPKKKVQSLINDLNKYRSQKKAEGQDMYHRLKEKYPYEKYGCDGELKIECQMRKYARHMQELDYTILALEHVIYSVEERMEKYDEQRR